MPCGHHNILVLSVAYIWNIYPQTHATLYSWWQHHSHRHDSKRTKNKSPWSCIWNLDSVCTCCDFQFGATCTGTCTSQVKMFEILIHRCSCQHTESFPFLQKLHNLCASWRMTLSQYKEDLKILATSKAVCQACVHMCMHALISIYYSNSHKFINNSQQFITGICTGFE